MTVGGRRARVPVRLALSALALGSVMVGQVAGPSSADPDAVAKAQKQLAAIQQQSSEIDARYSQLQAQLDDANTKLAAASKDLAGQQHRVADLSSHLGEFAMLRYQTSGVDLTTRLLTSSDDGDFLNQLATIQSVTDRANDRVQSLQQAQADLADTKENAAAARQQIAADKAEQAKVAAQYAAKEAEAKAVLNRLDAQEKQRLAALQAQQNAAAQAAATSRDQQRTSAPTSAPSAAAPAAGSAVPASGRAQQAISYAMAQVGKSYVMGATGPDAYDCSGLMMKAWASAGVQIPRTSQEQFGAGSPVSMDSLQPGDLVFYYSGITHVAMYIGGGRIVHAANPRTGIVTAPMNEMPVQGARRVG